MFSCFGFLSLYLCGKLHCFRPAGRAQAWRLCSVLTPLVAATLVGLTRMQDFRHHWEGKALTWYSMCSIMLYIIICLIAIADVLVGGSIGEIVYVQLSEWVSERKRERERERETLILYHWWSIVCSFAGLLLGILCYRHYYPSVFNANCHIPHAACMTTPDSTELPLNSSRLNLRKEWHWQ